MKRGFTLSELMLVVTIIAILAVFTLLSFQRQIIRGNDNKRKTDLANFKVIFDDYYNDNDCYPLMGDPDAKVIGTWNGYDCATKANGDFLKPYLDGKDIPCDPVTNEPYLYITLPEGAEPACSGYKLFAALGNLQDGDIPGSGCSPDPNQGCGYGPPDYSSPPAGFKYNYGISVGGTIANPEFDFTAPPLIPTPTTGPAPGQWVCTPYELNCQGKGAACLQQLIGLGCITWADSSACNARCVLRQDICNDSSICQ